MKFEFTNILKLAHSPVKNYGIPGLTSYLLSGNPADGNGCIRLFVNDTNHQQPIVPHSHRFKFISLVLCGEVVNRVWTRVNNSVAGDLYQASTLAYVGAPGRYASIDCGQPEHWRYKDTTYIAGQSYSMEHDEVHSIYFAKGTRVVFIEGAPVSNESLFLQPVIDGEVIPTFKIEDWMFKK